MGLPKPDLAVVPLDDGHDRAGFSCGVESLDRYFRTQAGQDVRRRANGVFVLGDNRGGSKDSRDGQLGPISYDDIIGRAFVVIWPAGDWRWL